MTPTGTVVLVRRWLLVALATLAVSGMCVRLGFWQWHRMEHKNDAAAAMERHLRQDPVPLTGSVAEFTRVAITGRFVPAKQVTVKFMVRNGAPGVDVVTPLLLSDGTVVLVDRGWMPSDNDDRQPTDIPPPPGGSVTIEGWWRPDSGAAPYAITPTGGQVRAISSRGLRAHVGYPVRPGYVNQQAPITKALSPEPKPPLRSALNFFYALQWWFFAALALFGIPWLALTGGSSSRQRSSPPPALT